MNFTAGTVKHYAFLSRIKVDDTEAEILAKELNKTVKGLEGLLKADTKGVEPLHTVMDEPLYLRPDTVSDGGIAEKIVSSAIENEDTFFTVPKILD